MLARAVADGLEEGVHEVTLRHWRNPLHLRSWGVGVVIDGGNGYKQRRQNKLTGRMSALKSRTAAAPRPAKLVGLQFDRTDVNEVEHDAGEASLVGIRGIGVV